MGASSWGSAERHWRKYRRTKCGVELLAVRVAESLSFGSASEAHASTASWSDHRKLCIRSFGLNGWPWGFSWGHHAGTSVSGSRLSRRPSASSWYSGRSSPVFGSATSSIRFGRSRRRGFVGSTGCSARLSGASVSAVAGERFELSGEVGPVGGRSSDGAWGILHLPLVNDQYNAFDLCAAGVVGARRVLHDSAQRVLAVEPAQEVGAVEDRGRH